MPQNKIKAYFEIAANKVYTWRSSDFHCLTLFKKLLLYLGLWLDKNNHGIAWKCYQLLISRSMFGIALYYVLVGFPILAYKTWNTDLHLTIESVSAIFVCALTLVSIGSPMFQQARLDTAIQTMEMLTEYGKRLPFQSKDIRDEKQKWAEWALSYFIGSMIGFSLLCSLLPALLENRQCLFFAWYPFDEKKSPYYEITFLVTLYFYSYAVIIDVNLACICWALLVESMGQFRLLQHNLRHVFDCRWHAVINRGQNGDSVADGINSFGIGGVNNLWPMNRSLQREEEFAQNLRSCIQHHVLNIRLVGEIQSMFQAPVFQQMASTLVGTCLGVVLILFADEIEQRTIMFILTVIIANIQTGLNCWIGDLLTEESGLVRDAVFDSNWLETPESLKRSMRIVMSRSNQPLVFTLAGHISLSRMTFYRVVKLNYSYCTAMMAYFQETVGI